MIGTVSSAHGVNGTIYMTSGCAAFPEPIPGDSREHAAQCAQFVDRGLKAIAASANAGDILFLPGLRTQRYREYWEPEMRRYVRSGQPYEDHRLNTDIASLQPFLNRGVRVVLEAPKPVYTYAPMRCSDWFNQMNPHCRAPEVTAAYQQDRRAAVMAIFARLKVLEQRIEIWDPFLLLCPGSTCSAVRDGKPLVSDGDHLTGYANEYLAPYFWAGIQ